MKVIVLSGTPMAIPALDFFDLNFLLSALICPEDTVASDVIPMEQWAVAHGVPCWKVKHESLNSELAELIEEISPDLVLVYGFPYALPLPVMDKVTYGCLSVQFSLLDNISGSVIIHRLQDSQSGPHIQHQNYSLQADENGTGPFGQLSLYAVDLIRCVVASARKEMMIDRYFRLIF